MSCSIEAIYVIALVVRYNKNPYLSVGLYCPAHVSSVDKARYPWQRVTMVLIILLLDPYVIGATWQLKKAEDHLKITKTFKNNLEMFSTNKNLRQFRIQHYSTLQIKRNNRNWYRYNNS